MIFDNVTCHSLSRYTPTIIYVLLLLLLLLYLLLVIVKIEICIVLIRQQTKDSARVSRLPNLSCHIHGFRCVQRNKVDTNMKKKKKWN